MYDIVYILQNGISTDEIRYSLRSVDRNFPVNKVWIYGGKPKGIEPDHYVKVIQTGDNRYQKVTNTIKKVCQNDQITSKFYLFNDDFFVMKKVEEVPLTASGTIDERIDEIERVHGFASKYGERLGKSAQRLQQKGYNTLCYAMHIPILVDRQKALEVINLFPDDPMFRCLYGNYVGQNTVIMPDCKVFNNEDPFIDTTFLSTDDTAWNNKAGEYIRSIFTEPSRWEHG